MQMIHQVTIKSLPLEWLWCETWCEAKLDAAVRIVAEWDDYDTKIETVQEKLARNRTELQNDPFEL